MSFIIDDADSIFNKIQELRRKDPLPIDPTTITIRSIPATNPPIAPRDSLGRLICPACNNARYTKPTTGSYKICINCVDTTGPSPTLKDAYR